MGQQTRFIIGSVIFLVIFHWCGHRPRAQTSPSPSGASDQFPPLKILIDAQIASNRVERGITQTESTSSVAAALGIKWPQLRVGIWGANYRDTVSNDSSNLRIFGAYKFIITSNFDVTGRFDLSQYAASGNNNGTIMSVDINLYTYHTQFEQVENWEGTGAPSMRFAFYKDFELLSYLLWKASAGYNMPAAASATGYFEFGSAIGVRYEELRADLNLSVTSNKDQLASRGKPAFWLSFTVATP